MSWSSAVEVAVGLVFAYFIFSSICSAINEGVARVLNSRGTQLFKSINALLGEVGLARAFWQHELIAGLGKSRSSAGTQQTAQAALANGIAQSANGSITSSVDKDTRKALPSYISPTTAVTAMRAVTTAIPAAPPSASVGPGAVAAAPTASGFRDVLDTIEATAHGDEQRIQADLEKWFNDAMDRLSGWYKRSVQIILLALAIAVTIAFNVNTFRIAQDLWRQPALQAVVGQQANQASQSQGSGQNASQSQPGQASLSTDVSQAETLPIGWGSSNQPHGNAAWWLTILGWLLTIGALSFGAPFWFDLLTRMNSLRATGPPAKT